MSPQESNLKATIAKIYVDSHTEYPDMRAKDWPDVFADKILEAFAKHQQALIQKFEKIIGEDEESHYDYNEARYGDSLADSGSVYYGRNELREEQRSALQKIREEI